MNTVTDAIDHANEILPGVPAPEGEIDLRWQAIIAVAEHLESDPELVWESRLALPLQALCAKCG